MNINCRVCLSYPNLGAVQTNNRAQAPLSLPAGATSSALVCAHGFLIIKPAAVYPNLGTINANVARQQMTNYTTGWAKSKSIQPHAVWYAKEPLRHLGPDKRWECQVWRTLGGDTVHLSDGMERGDP